MNKKVLLFLIITTLFVVKLTSCNNSGAGVNAVSGTITGEYASWSEVVIIHYDSLNNPIGTKTVPLLDGKFTLPQLQTQDLVSITEGFSEINGYSISDTSAYIGFDLRFYIRKDDEFKEIGLVGNNAVIYADRDVNVTNSKSDDIIEGPSDAHYRYYRLITTMNMREGWNIVVQSRVGIEKHPFGDVFVGTVLTNPLPSKTDWEVK